MTNSTGHALLYAYGLTKLAANTPSGYYPFFVSGEIIEFEWNGTCYLVSVNLTAPKSITVVLATEQKPYIHTSTHPIPDAKWDKELKRLSYTVVAPYGIISEQAIYSEEKPYYVLHDGVMISEVDLPGFKTWKSPCWTYDPNKKLVYVKAFHYSPVEVVISYEPLPFIPPPEKPPEVPVVPELPKPTPEQVEKAREWIITIMLDPRTIIILVIAILGFIFLVRKRE